MNNDMTVYSPTNLCEVTAEDMRNALRLIAKEVQSFRLEFEAGRHKIEKNTDSLEKATYSTKLRTKNKQLKKLKENLKTLCNVGKVVLSAKNRETQLLMGQLNHIRNESSYIRNSNAQNVCLIQKLQIENQNIHNDVQLLCNFIHLGYEKLQKMRNETPEYLPCIEELKALLLACGKYYVDYTDVRNRCDQLERKNRFLINKLNIVQNNLEATMEELRNLRSQNTKLRMKCEQNHKNGEAMKENMRSPHIRENNLDKISNHGIKSDCNTTASQHVISHLEAVKNLILDQDHMLKELKELYLEVTYTPKS